MKGRSTHPMTTEKNMKRLDGKKRKTKSFDTFIPVNKPNQIYIARFEGAYEMKEIEKGNKDAS